MRFERLRDSTESVADFIGESSSSESDDAASLSDFDSESNNYAN